MPVVIRKASLIDLEEIYLIELECFGHEAFPRIQIEYFLKNPNFVNLVATLDAELIGFVTGSLEYFKAETMGHIYSIDVKPRFRRKGIGSRLLNAIEFVFAEKGAKYCYLEVRAGNTAAKKLYLKNGHEEIKLLKDYYGFGANGIKLQKSLKQPYTATEK